jgi:hypothetical protein
MTWIEKAEALAEIAGCKIRKHGKFAVLQFDFPGDKHVTVAVDENIMSRDDFLTIVAERKQMGLRELS